MDSSEYLHTYPLLSNCIHLRRRRGPCSDTDMHHPVSSSPAVSDSGGIVRRSAVQLPYVVTSGILISHAPCPDGYKSWHEMWADWDLTDQITFFGDQITHRLLAILGLMQVVRCYCSGSFRHSVGRIVSGMVKEFFIDSERGSVSIQISAETHRLGTIVQHLHKPRSSAEDLQSSKRSNHTIPL